MPLAGSALSKIPGLCIVWLGLNTADQARSDQLLGEVILSLCIAGVSELREPIEFRGVLTKFAG